MLSLAFPICLSLTNPKRTTTNQEEEQLVGSVLTKHSLSRFLRLERPCWRGAGFKRFVDKNGSPVTGAGAGRAHREEKENKKWLHPIVVTLVRG